MASASEEPRLTPYDRLGGREVLQRITDRFYDLMDGDPAYARLRAMHAPDLAPMRRSLAGFLAAWCGGPRDWFEENPGKCMMSAHAGLPIDRETAGQWADAMRRAIADAAPADPDIATLVAERLEMIAHAMGGSRRV